jgi:hypothetical protein
MVKGIRNVVIAVLAAGALAAGASVVADAASNGSSGSSGAPPGTGQGARQGTPPQHPGETLLTDGTAQKVKDAALKKVPGATVIRVETDAEGSPYEAHLRKSDGTDVTAKVNKQFKVTDVQQGFGGGPGGPGGPPSGSNNGSYNGAPAGPSITG